jgi:hypothetical protein
MDLELDIRNEIMKWLPHDRNNQRLVAELDSLAFDELVIRFFNWLNRLIHPHPRQVFRSQDYIFRYLPPREQVYLEKLIEKIEIGDYLASHLSRGISNGFVEGSSKKVKKNLRQRVDLDLLLNDWGIHHIHLPNIFESDGFARRNPNFDSDLLLFAIFRNDAAYLIDVLPHGSSSDDRLVQITLQNWRDADLFIKAPGILPSNQKISRTDRSRIRSAGVNQPIEFEGSVFLPSTGGLTSAGTTQVAAFRTMRLLQSLNSVKNELEANPDHFKPQIEDCRKTYPQSPKFVIEFCMTARRWEFLIKERVTGCFIQLEV